MIINSMNNNNIHREGVWFRLKLKLVLLLH